MRDFTLDQSFLEELPADKEKGQSRRKVFEACYSFATPRKPSQPQLLHTSTDMLKELGISEDESKEKWFVNLVSGSEILQGTQPYAMCYGGHQFGHWAGQLGDGRAINLFTVIANKKHWTLQLKGAGETVYSRHADGLAVLRSSIREHLCSEAMHHLRVPTTRSLSLVLSGDEVLRDILYDGNPQMEKGAIVCRCASSFLRIGSFEIFAARRDEATLRKLINYTIKHHFPAIKETGDNAFLEFFKEVCEKNLTTVLHWQRVGFVHGVLNTDNTSILGLTIDYGPYGWLENFDPNWTPNTTDKDGRRYRFGWQPKMIQWNLMQLANCLFLLTGNAQPLEEILNDFTKQFNLRYQNMMRNKLGLAKSEIGDELWIDELKQLMYATEIDYTIFFRELSMGENDLKTILKKSSYLPYIESELIEKWRDWFQKYVSRVKEEQQDHAQRLKVMKLVNPKYVLRNYMAQLAIEKAEKGDYGLIDQFYKMLRKPYDEQPEFEKWYAKRPDWAKNKVGSSMLSCSS